MKNLFILTAFLLISGITTAQELRVNTYGGYVFDDRVDSYFSNTSYYDGTIKGGFRWGAGLEYLIPGKAAIELQYLRQDTNAPTVYQDGLQIQQTDFILAENWIMLNGTRYFPVNETVEPFMGLGLGMGIFNLENPDNNNTTNATKFAWNLRGGTNIWVSENVAIRVQAALFSAVQSMGGGLYFGTGGAGAGLSTYSTMYQFGFDGGLVFKLPQR
jgi:opacity protein-like surface antigen